MLVFCFSVPASKHILELPGLFISCFFFHGLPQLHWAHFLRQEADCLWFEANCLKAEGQYAPLWGAITQPDLSASVGLPLPKRHKWVAAAMVSSPTLSLFPHYSFQFSKLLCLRVQESEAIVPKPKGGMSEQGALLYTSLNLRRQPFPLEWNLYESMWAIPSKFTAVVLSDVQKDLWPPMQLYVLTCIRPIWAQNYHIHHVPIPFPTLMPSNNMASGCIPLGFQTPFKECSYSLSSSSGETVLQPPAKAFQLLSPSVVATPTGSR